MLRSHQLILIFLFVISANSQGCDPSMTHCLECTKNSLTCSRCEPGYYDIGGECSTTCPSLSVGLIIDSEGYCICDATTWVDKVNNICAVCHPNCPTCYGPGDKECGLDRKY